MGAGQSSLSFFTAHLRQTPTHVAKSSVAQQHNVSASDKLAYSNAKGRLTKELYSQGLNKKLAAIVSFHGKDLFAQPAEIFERTESRHIQAIPTALQEHVLGLAEDANVIQAITSSEHFDSLVQLITELEARGDDAALLTGALTPPLSPSHTGNMALAPPVADSNNGSNGYYYAKGASLGHLCLALAAFGVACPTCGTPSTASTASASDVKGNEGVAPASHSHAYAHAAMYAQEAKPDPRAVLVEAVMPLLVLVVVCSLMVHRGLAQSARAVFSHCFGAFLNRFKSMPSLATSLTATLKH